MPDDLIIRTSTDRARTLARVIDAAGNTSASGPGRGTPNGGTRQIVIEIRQNVAADDFDQFDAWLMKFDGTSWVDAEQAALRVRKVNDAAITASAVSPVRAVARTIGTFGWCVDSGTGSTTGPAVSGTCPCVCINAGDIIVNGIETTSQWSVALPTQYFRQTYGTIILPTNVFILEWDVATSKWIYDCGADLTATYLDDTDATADTTMDGEITLEWASLGAAPSLKLCVDGTVPDPGS